VPGYEGSGEQGGFSPADLLSAYKIPSTIPRSQTVAIVDAYDDPNAETDLNTYRSHYGLSQCTTTNGCFTKVNQAGEKANYPAANAGWSVEISLDLDMVSAICQECKILLVEANNNALSSMYAAEDEALALKATEVSNSWGTNEYSEETKADSHFDGTNVPITAASGDETLGPSYPAASQYVISVGGTTLRKAEGPRGWSETIWSDSGGGCSLYESKPVWQTDPSCTGRTASDVAAVADPESPVSVYDSYKVEGWILLGGTSVSAPIIAAVEAHAEGPTRSSDAEIFYRRALFDVVSGSNGGCGIRYYLCNGQEGYDGPTGWGTPDGALETEVGFHAITSPAPIVATNSAVLSGYVNPASLATNYWFEYGKTTSYGSSVSGSAGSGRLWKGVSQRVTGLKVRTSYHYRLVAQNASGTVYGVDHTFTTRPWEAAVTPVPAGSESSILKDVSCTSSETCLAVGPKSLGHGPFVESWNGTEWSIQTAPSPEGSELGELRGVSCASSTACTGVGAYKTSSSTVSPFADRWNGTEWSSQQTPSREGSKESWLNKVSCVSTTACTAVGVYTTSSGAWMALAEHWNGTGWSIQTTPIPGGASESWLTGVSCSSPALCTAAGAYVNSAGKAVTLAERWNGTEWSIQTTPNPEGAKESRLNGVSCSSSNLCTAAGEYQNSAGKGVTLVERWNGTEWSIQTTPNPGGSFNTLAGVSCASSTECLAVGEYSTATGEFGLVERWNGTSWVTEPAAMGVEVASLLAASCPAQQSAGCTAVGAQTEWRARYGYFVTLAENGVSPQVTPEWRLGDAALAEPIQSAATGTIKLTEGNETGSASLECEAQSKWSSGLGANGEITSFSGNCQGSWLEKAKCENTVTLQALGLPWHGTLIASEGSVEDVLTAAGFKWTCTVSKIAHEEECKGRLLAKMTNGASGVTATFLPQEAYDLCKGANIGLMAFEGSQAIATSHGGKLSVVTASESEKLSEAGWSVGGASVLEPLGITESGKIKLTSGSASTECEDSAGGSAFPFATGEVVSVTITKCSTGGWLEGRTCESGSETVEATNLPWRAELVTIEGATREVLTGEGKGTPAFKWKCKVSGHSEEIKCEGAVSVTVTNGPSGVTAAFIASEKLGLCTLEGSQSIETGAGKLEAT
jgi:hypothetical protein